MQTHRYDYSPIIQRKGLKWPNDARIALMVAPNIEFFHVDKVIPGAPSSQLPERHRLCASRLRIANRRLSDDGSSRQTWDTGHGAPELRCL